MADEPEDIPAASLNDLSEDVPAASPDDQPVDDKVESEKKSRKMKGWSKKVSDVGDAVPADTVPVESAAVSSPGPADQEEVSASKDNPGSESAAPADASSTSAATPNKALASEGKAEAKPKAKPKPKAKTSPQQSPDANRPSHAERKPVVSEDPYKDKHLSVKVLVASGANLRSAKFKGVVNTSCHVELLGAGRSVKALSRWHTQTINDTINPNWKDSHTWKETDFAPGDRIQFTVHSHDDVEDIILGSGTLDSRDFYPHGFDGKVELTGREEMGKDPHLKVKITVYSEEQENEIKVKEEKAKAKAKKKAQKAAKKESEQSPWEQKMKSLSQCSSRVAPGQVLKPKGTPVYTRLYDDHLQKQERIKTRVEAAQRVADDEFEACLNRSVMKPGTEEEVEGVIERLYGDALQKRERHEERKRLKEEQEDEEFGPQNPPEYDDPQATLDEMVERLTANAKAKQERLQQKRIKQEEAEFDYLKANSVHAKCEEPNEEIYERLHGEHASRNEKLQKKVDEVSKAATKDTPVFKYPKFTQKGLRLKIVGARRIARPDGGRKPEPFCICDYKGGVRAGQVQRAGTVQTRPVMKWSSNPIWNQEFDLTELYDGESPLSFTVLAEDFPEHRVLGRTVLNSSHFISKGFEGEIELIPPTKEETEIQVLSLVKHRLRAAGYFYGGMNLRRLHKHFDHEGSGYLTFENLKSAFRKDAKMTADMMSDELIKVVFSQIDRSKNGQVTVEEFEEWLMEQDPAAPDPEQALDLSADAAADSGAGVVLGDKVKLDDEASPPPRDEEEPSPENMPISPGSPEAPGQSEPEPSPDKVAFAAAPSSPSRPRRGPVLLVKIEVLPPRSQGKRAFLEGSVQRLYGKHAERLEKLENKKESAIRQLDKRASPELGQRAVSMPNVSAQSQEFYQRLYSDAHRRHVDKRIKMKESLRELKEAQDKDSVHAAALKRHAWQPEEIDSIFERVYNPPPKCHKLMLSSRAERMGRAELDEPDDESVPEDETQMISPLTSPDGFTYRRQGLFFSRQALDGAKSYSDNAWSPHASGDSSSYGSPSPLHEVADYNRFHGERSTSSLRQEASEKRAKGERSHRTRERPTPPTIVVQSPSGERADHGHGMILDAPPAQNHDEEELKSPARRSVRQAEPVALEDHPSSRHPSRRSHAAGPSESVSKSSRRRFPGESPLGPVFEDEDDMPDLHYSVDSSSIKKKEYVDRPPPSPSVYSRASPGTLNGPPSVRHSVRASFRS